jgi:hypothetical protein
MASYFISTSFIRFDCNPFIANSCISFYSNVLLSFKTFELELNLFLENFWNALRLASSREASRDVTLKRSDTEQRRIMNYIEFAKCLWICCNFLKRTCAQNQRELAKV